MLMDGFPPTRDDSKGWVSVNRNDSVAVSQNFFGFYDLLLADSFYGARLPFTEN